MAHITNTEAARFSSLAKTTGTTTLPANETAWKALTVTEIAGIREFPALGNPANVINVAQYGDKLSKTIQGQADAPALEFVLNWTGSDHSDLEAGNTVYGWRARITDVEGTQSSTTEQDDYYFLATIASNVVTPGLTEANTGTLTLSLQSDFSGPYTITA